MKKLLFLIVLGLGWQLTAMEGGEPVLKKRKGEAESEYLGAEPMVQEVLTVQKQDALNRSLWEGDQNDEQVFLQSDRGELFSILVRKAQLSGTLRGLIEDIGIDRDIPLPNISSQVLYVLVNLLNQLEWLLAKSGQLPQDSSHKHLAAEKQDPYLYVPSAFQPMVNQVLDGKHLFLIFKVLEAANYLDIPFILNGVAAVIADRIAIKNLDQGRYAYLLDTLLFSQEKGINAEEVFSRLGIGILVNVPRDLWQYIARHVAMRVRGITREYSIADYIKDHGQPQLQKWPENWKDLELGVVGFGLDADWGVGDDEIPDWLALNNKKLTSFFGVSLLATKKNVKILNLGSNCFFDLYGDFQKPKYPLFAGFDQLTILFLDNNQLTHLEPNWALGLSKLKELHLNNNELRILKNGWATDLAQLEILRLENNLIATLEPDWSNGLKSVYVLKLSHNKLRGLRNGWVKGVTKFIDVLLDYNQIATIEEGWVPNVEAGHSVIDLSNNQIRVLPIGRQDAARLNKLEVLILESNLLAPDEQAKIKKALPRVQEIRF